jgi:ubiquinone/menaquinone biosynthesis C-methylase UbiE
VTNSFPEFKDKEKALVKNYRIKKTIKLLDILKKKSVKVKNCYNKTVRSVIAFFRQLVYYNYNKVKFREFKHIRKKTNKIN